PRSASRCPRRVRHARAPPVPRYAQGLRPRSASTETRLARPPACAGGQSVVAVLLVHAARPDLDAGVLRQYIAKSRRREESSQRDRCRPSSPVPLWWATSSVRRKTRAARRASPGAGRSGTAAYLQERMRSAEPLGGG